ncbi:MAG: InlB B-repeat-containing protein, partial [Planctomycetota bacterium]
YAIDATAGPNGSVHPTDESASFDESVSFTATPDLGYEVDTWYLDGSTAQVGGRTYELSDIDADYSVHVTFRQALAYSLETIEFDDEEEFEARTINNNVIDPDQPGKARVYVQRVTGVGPDPEGVMEMHNLKDLDPTSPTFGRFIHARAKGIFARTGAHEILVRFAKGIFARTGAHEILVRFKYLFATATPGVELVVYLSDSPELLVPGDPQRSQHYLEVARIPAPPFPRPGSAGSGRFAVFQKIVWTGHLDLSEGLYIELELFEPPQNGILLASTLPRVAADSGGSSAYIDDWSPAVQCYGICLDINWDNFVDEADFLMVVGGSGCAATGETACMDGVLSHDGYMDSYDVVSWDWALNSEHRLLNYCGVPLAAGGTSVGLMSTAGAGVEASRASSLLADLPPSLGDLLIAGKSGAADAPSKLRDGLYIFNQDGIWGGSPEPASDRCKRDLPAQFRNRAAPSRQRKRSGHSTGRD